MRSSVLSSKPNCILDFKKEDIINSRLLGVQIPNAFCVTYDEYFLFTRLPSSGEMSPEQQRAAVHQRLSLVADEILRLLEMVMGEYEAEVSGSPEEIERYRQLLDVALKTEANLNRTGTFYILCSCH